MPEQLTIVPVILSGGMGTRLWPLSRAMYPKQSMNLASRQTMIQDCAARFRADGFAPPIIICNEAHRFVIARQMREIGVRPTAIILEPVGRNTAAAVVAALSVKMVSEDALVLLAPSDHVVADHRSFLAAIMSAAIAAKRGALVAFGVAPERPETGYGYIKAGDTFEALTGVRQVERFVEKPDLERAKGFLEEGGYSWNVGMFLYAPDAFLSEIERFEPAVAEAARASLDQAEHNLDFIRLDKKSFEASPSLPVDVAVMEKTDKAAVVSVSMGWNDVGSWSALWDIAEKDGSCNWTSGDVIVENVTNCYVRSESKLTTVLGLDGVVVVVLVAGREAAQDVKGLVEELKLRKRPEVETHPDVFDPGAAPWGSYMGIDIGPRYQVKHISVDPGQRLSLQMHHHRSEHWIVVEGTAKVTRGEKEFLIHENESAYIPVGISHRLENPGKVTLKLIEVQSGSYLGEDDIIRFEDVYGRS